MAPKGKSKAVSEASSLEAPSSSLDAPASSPAPASSDPAGKGKGKVTEESVNVPLTDAPASGSGLSLEEKLGSLRTTTPDSGFIEDDSDEELEVEVKTEAFNRVRYTAILLIPVALALEVASVITTVRTLMRRVWSSTLSVGAVDSAKFQELLPAYVAKTRYSRLQVSLLREEDIMSIRSKEVDYTRPNGTVFRLYWQHTDDPAFVRERATNKLAIEVVIRDSYHAAASLPASPLITPILLDPAMVLISTGGNREEWICTQVGCGKAKGKSFMTAADHVTSANHLIHLEKLGSATRVSLERASLNVTKKEYGL
ncbi:unnamed protein product [Closterium sp. Naga37s-1]|nr:unnamed protein product [Closterium sp. Naga37s-1]CAI5492665.1 unnamed protein product [Closterium sp. Naga37s-1]